MSEPNFFIIGAPKCGTTALAHYLAEHPRIFMSEEKEPFFFSREDIPLLPEYFGPRLDTLDDYLALFDSAGPEHVAIGEASTTYFWSRRAVPAILALNPDARFIVMLRHPVDMVYSLYWHERHRLLEPEEEFERAWRRQPDREAADDPRTLRLQYRWRASLGTHVHRLLEHARRDRVLFILQEDFREDPGAVYRETLDFLNVPDDGRREFPRVNASRTHRSRLLGQVLLRGPAALGPIGRGMSRALRMMGIRGMRQRLIDLLSRVRPYPPMDPALRRQLTEEFREEVLLLERMLERDLSHWLADARGEDPASTEGSRGRTEAEIAEAAGQTVRH